MLDRSLRDFPDLGMLHCEVGGFPTGSAPTVANHLRVCGLRHGRTMSDETNVNFDKRDANDAETVTTDETIATDPEQAWREGIDGQLYGLAEQLTAVLAAVDRSDELQKQLDDSRGLRRMAEANEDAANRRASRNGKIAVFTALLLFVTAFFTGAYIRKAQDDANSNGNQPVEVVINRGGLWVNGQFKGYVDDPYWGLAEPTPRELPPYCGDIKDFVLQFPLNERAALAESCQP